MKKKIILIVSYAFYFQLLTSCTINCQPKDNVIQHIHDTAVILNEEAQSLSSYNFKTQEYNPDALILHGGTPRGLFFDEGSSHGYVTSSSANHVEIFQIKADSMRYKKYISMPQNCSPYNARDFGNASSFYVSCFQTGEVLKIDVDSGNIINRIAGLEHPQDFILDNNTLYILETHYISPNVYGSPIITLTDKSLNIKQKITLSQPSAKNPTNIHLYPDTQEVHILFTNDYVTPSVMGVYSSSNMSFISSLTLPTSSLSEGYEYGDHLYLLGNTPDIIEYNRKTKTIVTPFFSRSDSGKNIYYPSGLGIYKSTVILSWTNHIGDDDLFIGDISKIRTQHKSIPASSGTSHITIFN